ncbi:MULTISPECIES: hypothetical protein [unclassified Cyanobium]|uniref:hypothetical protein n=1 Tax=unclassified Cyanobium TaxID=2627006 RepID=UPI0020CCE063|nr:MULTISPECIES: hypothetical protein [unclassified Cyanobium]MCP9777356.1 hypothetical protein [Cyanobium sp. Tous-M-B4]MCP9875729.1 hypothetical protein [Cyanobium sp. A2C-AMD]
MYRFRLSSEQVQLELVANGNSARLPFQVIGPTTEVAFLEELIEESLGSLTLNPRELFGFLGSDPWVKEAFQAPQVVEGDLNAAASTDTSFQRQNLGNKLVQAGVLDIEELEQLLEDYRPFAETQRFGEFLRLNLQVPPQMLDLLLNPALFDEQGFNEKRLGERLVETGCITHEQLDQALELQRSKGGRVGELLAELGFISTTTARFFSLAKVNEKGQIDYQAG